MSAAAIRAVHGDDESMTRSVGPTIALDALPVSGVRLMHHGIAHLSFEDWVYFIFDHPAEGPQWYGAADALFWNGSAELTAEYVIRLSEIASTSSCSAAAAGVGGLSRCRAEHGAQLPDQLRPRRAHALS